MLEIEYVTDKNGQPKAVVIPIELWKRLLPNENLAVEELSERTRVTRVTRVRRNQGRVPPHGSPAGRAPAVTDVRRDEPGKYRAKRRFCPTYGATASWDTSRQYPTGETL
jgi:hypothetical protein